MQRDAGTTPGAHTLRNARTDGGVNHFNKRSEVPLPQEGGKRRAAS